MQKLEKMATARHCNLKAVRRGARRSTLLTHEAHSVPEWAGQISTQFFKVQIKLWSRFSTAVASVLPSIVFWNEAPRLKRIWTPSEPIIDLCLLFTPIQSATSLARDMSLATFKTKLKTYLFRHSQWLSKTTRRCCGVFAIPAPRY